MYTNLGGWCSLGLYWVKIFPDSNSWQRKFQNVMGSPTITLNPNHPTPIPVGILQKGAYWKWTRFPFDKGDFGKVQKTSDPNGSKHQPKS